MGNSDVIVRDIEELQELKRMRDEIDAAIEAASDKVKADLGTTETGTFGPYKVTWKEVTSTRLDTVALRKTMPADVLAPFMRTSTSRPLKIT